MKEITLYREYNGQYSTSEARQDDVSGVYVQKEHLTDLKAENDELRSYSAKLKESLNLCLIGYTNNYPLSDESRDEWVELVTGKQPPSMS